MPQMSFHSESAALAPPHERVDPPEVLDLAEDRLDDRLVLPVELPTPLVGHLAVHRVEQGHVLPEQAAPISARVGFFLTLRTAT